jgi:hypothetical protein
MWITFASNDVGLWEALRIILSFEPHATSHLSSAGFFINHGEQYAAPIQVSFEAPFVRRTARRGRKHNRQQQAIARTLVFNQQHVRLRVDLDGKESI